MGSCLMLLVFFAAHLGLIWYALDLPTLQTVFLAGVMALCLWGAVMLLDGARSKEDSGG